MAHIPERFSPAVIGCESVPFVEGKLDLSGVPIKHHKEVKRQFYDAFPYLAEEKKPQGEEPKPDDTPLDEAPDLTVEYEPQELEPAEPPLISE